MWWVVLIICLVAIIVVGWVLYSMDTSYVPAWQPLIQPVTDLSMNIYVPFYLPSNSLNLSSIKKEIDSFGTLTWINSENTYALVNTTMNAFQNWLGVEYPLSIVNGFLGCYNKNVVLPYDMIALIDFWGPNSFDNFKTIDGWSSELNISSTPLGTPGINNFNIVEEGGVVRNLIPTQETRVGILCSDLSALPSSVALAQLALALNIPESQFLSRIVSTTFNYNAAWGDDPIIEIPTNFTSNTLNDMNGTEFELNLDLQAIFSVNPNAIVYIYYTDNSDPMIALQYSLITPQAPKIWSSSIGLPVKFSAKVMARVNQELVWLAQNGITTLQASGDQGMYCSSLNNNPDYLSQTFNAKTPDTTTGYFNSVSTLMIGGFSRAQDATAHVSMTLQQFDNTWRNLFFASGAGFSRGYHTEASYKQHMKGVYLHTYPSPSNFVQLDYSGNMRPDFVGIGSASLANGDGTWTSSGGTSMATPFTASTLSLIAKNKVLTNINQFLYTHPEVFIRPISNPNTFYNLPGFTSDPKLTWDPVQGLGVLNISKFIDII